MCSKPVYLLIRYVSEKVRAMYIVQSVASFSVVLSMFRVCCAFISAFLCFVFSPFVEMVQAIQAVIAICKERLMAMATAPDTSYGRAAFGVDGAVNRRFLWHLFLDFSIAIQFLKDTGLIRSQMTCETCGLDMTWSAIPQRRDRFRWRCRRRAATLSFSMFSSFYLFYIPEGSSLILFPLLLLLLCVMCVQSNSIFFILFDFLLASVG